MKIIKRYLFFIVTIVILIVLFLVDRSIGQSAFDTTVYSLKEMIVVLPPIFILLGLLDVWIPRETIIKYMGEKSGFIGILLSILFGATAAGPLYAAFPIAGVFMKKGVKFSNIMFFIGAWSTLKIPMFLFEAASMGYKFALIRLGLSLIGITLISFAMKFSIKQNEIAEIYNGLQTE
jgi:uncharacterized membrane protein YraQ (UPF0718 family)